MKSFLYALAGNAIGTPGIVTGKAMIVTGTVVAAQGAKLVETSANFKSSMDQKAATEAEIETTQKEERELRRHNEVMKKLEDAQAEERERHERMTQGPTLVPDDQRMAMA